MQMKDLALQQGGYLEGIGEGTVGPLSLATGPCRQCWELDSARKREMTSCFCTSMFTYLCHWNTCKTTIMLSMQIETSGIIH